MMRRIVLSLLACAATLAGANVQIGVFGLFRPQRLVVKPALGTVIQIEAGQERRFLEGGHAAGLTVFGQEVDCTIRGAPITAARIRVSGRGGGPAEFLLSVPTKIERKFAGVLEITVHDGALQPVLEVDREAVVASIVAAESPAEAAPGALQAQAIVTRSYLAASGRRHAGYDFCDTTHCQYFREPPSTAGFAFQAASNTRDLVLLYEGSILAAMYSASCGGRTRTAAEAGLPVPASGYPYFAVECAECRSRSARWTTVLTKAEAAPLLAAPHSENARLTIGRVLGWSRVPGNNYEIRIEGDSVILEGRGAGHGMGLCQMGGAGMAGADARSILSYYFPATSVERR